MQWEGDSFLSLLRTWIFHKAWWNLICCYVCMCDLMPMHTYTNGMHIENDGLRCAAQQNKCNNLDFYFFDNNKHRPPWWTQWTCFTSLSSMQSWFYFGCCLIKANNSQREGAGALITAVMWLKVIAGVIRPETSVLVVKSRFNVMVCMFLHARRMFTLPTRCSWITKTLNASNLIHQLKNELG